MDPSLSTPTSGDELQGAAADCNSAGETHAWFDSRVAHQPAARGSGTVAGQAGQGCHR